MTKVLLSRRGVEFDALDMMNDPETLEQLRALGRRGAITRGRVGDRQLIGRSLLQTVQAQVDQGGVHGVRSQGVWTGGLTSIIVCSTGTLQRSVIGAPNSSVSGSSPSGRSTRRRRVGLTTA